MAVSSGSSEVTVVVIGDGIVEESVCKDRSEEFVANRRLKSRPASRPPAAGTSVGVAHSPGWSPPVPGGEWALVWYQISNSPVALVVKRTAMIRERREEKD